MEVRAKARIEGKVAAIVDEWHLVINRGSADGVEEGMVFEVYEPGVEIEDPEGRYGVIARIGDLVKVRVRVVRILGEHAALCKAIPGEGTLVAPSPIEATMRLYERRHLGMPVDEEEVLRPEEKRLVRRGDPVRQVVE